MDIKDMLSQIISEAGDTGMQVKIYDKLSDKHYDIVDIVLVPTLRQLDIEIDTTE